MRLANEVYKVVEIDWENVTLPLKEGTPVSAAGVEANNPNAIGLVPMTYDAPEPEKIYVICGGDVDLEDVEKAYGKKLMDGAKSALSAIRFHETDGAVKKESALPWQEGGQWYKAAWTVTMDENGDYTGELIENGTDDFIIEHYNWIPGKGLSFTLACDPNEYYVLDYKSVFVGDFTALCDQPVIYSPASNEYIFQLSPNYLNVDEPVTIHRWFFIKEGLR